MLINNGLSPGASFLPVLQEDKDLVHEFVQNDGLACLIRVGHSADQNFQNYILRGTLTLVVFFILDSVSATILAC